MKNTILLALLALFMTATVQAQSTADSIAAKYKLLPMPEPLTIEKAFPVLGTYQIAPETEGAEAQVVTITLDPENKGIIWVEGLKEGKLKAYLKKAPASYRILSQKTEAGKSIPEGTLLYDPALNVLQIAIGKSFNDADPTTAFSNTSTSTSSKSKSKTKVKYYTASKVIAEPVVEDATSTTLLQ